MLNEQSAMPAAVRWFLLAVLSIVTAAGLAAILKVLTGGHELLNLTQHVPWGLWVASYIFFLGLSAGSFLLSTLIYVFGVKRLEPIGPWALFQALICLLLGGALIVLDLGHPERGYLILLHMNPSSVMAWMGIFYNLYILVVVVELYLVLRPGLIRRAEEGSKLCRWLALGSTDLSAGSIDRDRRWLKIMGIIGIPVAISVHGGVGAIFAVAKARPNWFGGLFPVLFLISALLSGGALLTFLTAAFSRLPRLEKSELVRTLAHLTLGILLLEVLMLGSEILVTFYGEIVHDEIGWMLTLFGPMWWVFWIVQVLFGMVLPILLVAMRPTGRSIFWLGLANLLIVAGMFGARLNIVIPPLIQPAFDTMPQAYQHARFAWGYVPSTVEWLVSLGVASVGIWIFLVADKLLPFEQTQTANNVPAATVTGGE